MLNREDVRKVLVAYGEVIRNFKDNGRDLEDISMREMHEAVLEQIMIQDREDKPKG